MSANVCDPQHYCIWYDILIKERNIAKLSFTRQLLITVILTDFVTCDDFVSAGAEQPGSSSHWGAAVGGVIGNSVLIFVVVAVW